MAQDKLQPRGSAAEVVLSTAKVGALVAAYVIPRAGSVLSADAVVEHPRQHLASCKAPKVVYVVDDFPRTRNGEMLRRALTPGRARQ